MSEDLASRLATSAAAGTELDLTGAESRDVPGEVLEQVLLGTDPAPRAVKLRGARITGRLDLEAAAFTCPVALTDCEFDDAVVLDEARTGAMRIMGCRLERGLSGRQLHTAGDLALWNCHLSGAVVLRGANIGGRLTLSGTTFAPDDGWALNGEMLVVDEDVFMTAVEAHGELRLTGARIGGELNLAGATLRGEESALQADLIQIEHGAVLRDGFECHGGISIVGGRIGGQLTLSGAVIAVEEEGIAFNAQALTVGQGLFAGGLSANGDIRLPSAEISGQLNFNGAHIGALAADHLHVEGSALFQEGFRADGRLAFRGARIAGQLGFLDAALARDHALTLFETSAQSLWIGFTERPTGTLDLRAARFESIIDSGPALDAQWPRYMLRGCQYDALESTPPAGVERRLEWLAGDPEGYSPQPFEQLAAAYRRAGNDEDARTVLIEKHRRRRATLGLRGKLWNWFLEVTVGHGYRPSLALVWLGGLLTIGAVLFGTVFDDRMTAARDAATVPEFQPVIYTLDVLVPVISLGQRVAWVPHGAAQWLSLALTVTGWLLTTALVGGIAARRQ